MQVHGAVCTTTNTTMGDEEREAIYQKIQSLKIHLPDIKQVYFKILRDIQQIPSYVIPGQCSDDYEEYRKLMYKLNKVINWLSISKEGIQPDLIENLPQIERIVCRIVANKKKQIIASQSQDISMQISPVNHDYNMLNQDINVNMQVESTSIHSDTNLFQANHHSVENLNQLTLRLSNLNNGIEQSGKERPGVGSGVSQQSSIIQYLNLNQQRTAGDKFPKSASQNSMNLTLPKDQLKNGILSPTTIVSSSLENGANNLNVDKNLHSQFPIGLTLGTSSYPLLDEYTAVGTVQNNAVEAYEKVTEFSLPPEDLSSRVTDIQATVNLTDRTQSCNTSMDSRSEIYRDHSNQTDNMMWQFTNVKNKHKRDSTSISHLDDITDPQKFARGTSIEEAIISPRAQKRKIEFNHSLQEAIENINRKLFNTEVKIENDAIDEGPIVKCSFTPMSYNSDMVLCFSSPEAQIMPLRLLLPSNYPDGFPVILNPLPDHNLQKEDDNLNGMIQSRFVSLVGSSPHLMSFEDMVRSWDSTVRGVVSESFLTSNCTTGW